MDSLWQDMQKQLDALAAANLLRRPAVMDSACGPKVTIGGKEIVCLCSNDYLGLANDPAVKAAAVEAVGRWGVGAGASRLVSGTTSLHAQLERRLAEFKDAEAAVVTSTGWMANHAAIHALAGQKDLILCDKLNHASILDAAMSSGARVRTYAHLDMCRLESLMASHRSEHRRCLIVTDSLFSMDGDVAPLSQIVQIKRRFDAQLLIDEAHATGVLGASGRGAAELLGVEQEIDATVGTLSKAVGAIGGFIAGPRVLIETIVNSGREFIYTTALPPALCAAALTALDIIRDQPQRRAKLLEMSRWLWAELKTNRDGPHLLGDLEGLAVDGTSTGAARQKASSMPGHALGGSKGITNAFPERKIIGDCPELNGRIVTQIIPVIVGDAAKALELSRALLEAGFLVPAIRPPTVPKGSSRLRVSLSAAHEMDDLRRFVAALTKAANSLA